MELYQVVTLISNLGALSVAGILYFAYLKNIRSQLTLKDEQIKVVENNLKFFKDKLLELERLTPQFMEQQLNSRIKIREDEVKRLSEDGESNQQEIKTKGVEIERLKQELETFTELGLMLRVWDSELGDYKSVPQTDLTIRNLGEVLVDSATLMICDPWYVHRSKDREKEDHSILKYRFQYKTTGQIQTVESDEVTFEVYELEGSFTARELVKKGLFQELEIPTSLPAAPESYIKTSSGYTKPGSITLNTFCNGDTGAGLTFALGGDGAYPVRAEYYDDVLQRIIIDI